MKSFGMLFLCNFNMEACRMEEATFELLGVYHFSLWTQFPCPKSHGSAGTTLLQQRKYSDITPNLIVILKKKIISLVCRLAISRRMYKLILLPNHRRMWTNHEFPSQTFMCLLDTEFNIFHDGKTWQVVDCLWCFSFDSLHMSWHDLVHI